MSSAIPDTYASNIADYTFVNSVSEILGIRNEFTLLPLSYLISHRHLYSE